MMPQDHHVKRNDPIYKLSIQHDAMIYVALKEDD